MKNVLCLTIFFFGPLAYVTSNQHLNRRGRSYSPREKTLLQHTWEALFKLMAPDEPFKDPPFSLACIAMDMKLKCDFSKPKNGIPCNFGKTTCYFVLDKKTLTVSAISKTNDEIPSDSDQWINSLALQAVVLPFQINSDTYTILNPGVAPWFFTDDLGGCDMFVAIAAYPGSGTMVIHSNRNNIMDVSKNLQSKGEDVDEMLKRISKLDGYEWKVIARVYYGPTTEIEKKKFGLDRYEEKHPGIKLIGYNENSEKTNKIVFFGHFVAVFSERLMKIPPHWNFILKGYWTGKILGEFRVSAKGRLF